MVRVVSEEMFNEVVQENMEEFGMTREEAIQDAVKQFEAQGVDLSNVIKKVSSGILPQEAKNPIILASRKLEIYVLSEGPSEEIIYELSTLGELCDKSISHRVFAGKNNLYTRSLEILQKFNDNKEIIKTTYKTLTSLMTDQPDLLNSFAVFLITSSLEKERDPEALQPLLSWIKVCCIKHEKNRQDFYNGGIVTHLKSLLEEFNTVPSIVKGVGSVFRALVLDDDVRVEFGKAHEHARGIADACLEMLTTYLKQHEYDKDVVGEMVLSLAALIVRNEYCEKVVEAGGGLGLVYIIGVLLNYPDSEKLNRQCMKLFKVLAGNDKTKSLMASQGVAIYIVSAMNRHQYSAELTTAGNGCIAAMTLRSPENSKLFIAAGAANSIMEGMRKHSKDLDVQKQGCWAIRNIVSRSKDLCPVFLELGAEEYLNYVLTTYTTYCEYDAKAALRDLGCAVQLREEWTGTGGALN